MSIIWKYLDKKAAAIAALKDYDSMQGKSEIYVSDGL